ncbi:Six-hairpin glycosidase-like protein [Staphylotrichum tortipilum]|uniref:Glucoamylase n=1 Tax=Staphylotrichum tortipilum TaxID=2831512 RepID=A0AAN6MB94_9PEZI|nr:Six-hairpin glycosidase-like protein [Staphylotrichum longicolle]
MPSIASLALASLLAVPGISTLIPKLPLEKYIKSERAIALQGVLDNIGPNGVKVPGAGRGIVIASPSKVDPDYFYTWTRDAALTLKTLIDEFLLGNKALQPYIEDYVHSQAVLQTVSNPSGTLLPSGSGLGEPKFTANGTRFNGNWGRPQRDGPSLRAVALIQYSNYLISRGKRERVKTEIWPIIANDLSYTGQYWNSTGFDLWEEVSGSSFFTTQNQYRSLIEGAALAKTLDVPCTGCGQAPQVLCFLQSYWNGKSFTANFITGSNNRGGVDANTILGPIALFDAGAPCDSPTLQPCHSRSLANFKVFVDTFRNSALYPINAGISQGKGVALGRYPEDTYYNGNPWYLITLGAAEFLYDAVAGWSKNGYLTIDGASLPFFKELYPLARVGKFSWYHPSYYVLQHLVRTYADTFVAVAQKYTPANGMLAEQFLKSAPFTPISAANLTWSFASFVSMAQRRDGRFPTSWVPRSGPQKPVVPSVCAASSVQGTYAPATAAGAPNVTAPCVSTVRFVLNATTYYGENVYITGDGPTLGNWDLAIAYPLLSSNYTAERPMWWADVPLDMTAGSGTTTVKYKYARQQNCGQDWIVEAAERTVQVPACRTDGSSQVLVETNDAFIGQGGTPGSC